MAHYQGLFPRWAHCMYWAKTTQRLFCTLPCESHESVGEISEICSSLQDTPNISGLLSVAIFCSSLPGLLSLSLSLCTASLRGSFCIVYLHGFTLISFSRKLYFNYKSWHFSTRLLRGHFTSITLGAFHWLILSWIPVSLGTFPVWGTLNFVRVSMPRFTKRFHSRCSCLTDHDEPARWEIVTFCFGQSQ